MYKIDSGKFDQTLLQFVGCVLERQENDHYQHSTKISFKSGFLQETEGYKLDVWTQSQGILQKDIWNKETLWKYDILRRVVSCMNLKMDSGKQQNLLDWRDIEYFKEKISEHPQRAESLIYQIYCTSDDKRSFHEAIALFGNRYPLLSFLFFLKANPSRNIPRYLPVRPDKMSSRFEHLGIVTDCFPRNFTWEHYQEYLCILQEVQHRLNERFASDVTLLDAHSFVWSMWILDEASGEKSPVSDLPQQFHAIEKETAPLQGDTRDAVVKVRVNQSVFRERLLERYHKCCLCGVSNPDLLTASHIKPWADSGPLEKIDVDNGFLFCPNHDRLFDQGLISFEDSGAILLSERLSSYDRLFTNVAEGQKIHLTDGNKPYLLYHREHIFKH